MADARTIATYEARAADYARLVDEDAAPDQDLAAFLQALPGGARVLDLGCGPGRLAALMRDAGCDVDPVDAAPAMVALARERFGLPARLATFDDLDAVQAYDAVWANFSLLHAPTADLPRHLDAIVRALKPGGLFHIGMKTGSGEARDGIGRRYTYVTVTGLHALLADAGLQVIATREGKGAGLAGTVDPFVICRARKDG